MDIIIGKTAGFCFGVENAVTKAEEEVKKDKELYCLGELVHNKQVTEELSQKGMRFTENIENAGKKVIIRSHGAEKEIYDKAKKLSIELIDLTCPKVIYIHNIVEEYSNNQYFIFITGQKEHPEMIGTVSYCNNNYSIIENEEEISSSIEKFKKSNKQKALIISQTTFSMEKFQKIEEEIKKKISSENLEIKNTICNATKQRQTETEEIAKNVDAMMIVGGKHSSNSNKLYELSKKYCQNVMFVETEEDINIKEIKNIKKIGIMAGASTPQKSIKKIVEKLSKI